MKHVDKILADIHHCINHNTYQSFETEKLELKDMSGGGDWTELYKTACAFLNTKGGIIIVGIYEDTKNKHYRLTGYKAHNEEKTKQLPAQYVNQGEQPLSLEDKFYFETRSFQDKQLLVIYVEELPDDEKFAFYKKNNTAYERVITGDHKISSRKIEAHEEYKQELHLARELMPVPRATLQDLDVDKLNEYIQLLNRDIKIETLKPNMQAAEAFLAKRWFIRQNDVTVLGMLVCGKEPYYFLESRCQVDCYVDSEVAFIENKKILKDNIIPLMENSLAFVYQNTQTGISLEQGGTRTSEYPENLMRESMNNALAHRDYKTNRYVSIIIKPNRHIEIRNPGSFKESLLIEYPDHAMPIRRIIPGQPGSKNPKLADVLKVFDKWEGRGIGMATLTNECLKNKIDLPYYRFYVEKELSLFIPKGQLLDEKMKLLFEAYQGFIDTLLMGEELTREHQLVLAYLYKSEEQNRNYHYTILLTPDNNHSEALRFLEEYKLIFKHESSPKLNPVYLVHRQFWQRNYYTELQQQFGEDYFKLLSKEHKEVLDVIYLYTHFSKHETVSANQVGNILYHRQHPQINDVREYENFKRQIRYRFNQLEKNSFIVKQAHGQYRLNTTVSQPSLLS